MLYKVPISYFRAFKLFFKLFKKKLEDRKRWGYLINFWGKLIPTSLAFQLPFRSPLRWYSNVTSG